LTVIIALFLWKSGHVQKGLEKVITEMDIHVKTVVDPALGSMKTSLETMNGDIHKATAEIEGFQTAAMLPVQSMVPIVNGMRENVTAFESEIRDISNKLAQVATKTDKFGETDLLMRELHGLFVGSPSKGRAGEEILKKVMDLPIKMGLIATDQPIGSDRVEYAIKFKDGKLLPIDATVRSTREISELSDQTLGPEKRAELAKSIKKAVKAKMEEVGKYIRPPITVDLAIVAVPDSIMQIASELTSEALERKVFLVWFSALPYFSFYVNKIYELYAVRGDVARLQEKLQRIGHHMSTLSDSFFSTSFDRPLGKLQEGVATIKGTAREISGTLALESADDTPSLLPTVMKSRLSDAKAGQEL